MPSFKTAGKSKEDLAVVAQISGLLSAEETAGMTRAQLVKLILSANDEAKKVNGTSPSHSTDEKNDSDEKSVSGDEQQEKTPAKLKRTASRVSASASKAAASGSRTVSRRPRAKKSDQADDRQLSEQQESGSEQSVQSDIPEKTKTAVQAASDAQLKSSEKPAVADELKQSAKEKKTTRGRKKSVLAVSEKSDQAEDNQQQADDQPGKSRKNETAAEKTTGKVSGGTKKSASKTESKTAVRKTSARKRTSVKTDSDVTSPEQNSRIDDKHQAAAENEIMADESSDKKAAGTRKKVTANKRPAGRTRKTPQSKTKIDQSEGQTQTDTHKGSALVTGEQGASLQNESDKDQTHTDKNKSDTIPLETIQPGLNGTAKNEDKNQSEDVPAKKAEEMQHVIKFVPKQSASDENSGNNQVLSDDASPEAASAAADQEHDNRAVKADRNSFAAQSKPTQDKNRFSSRQFNKPETAADTKSDQKTNNRQTQSGDIEQVKGKRPHVEAGEVQAGVLEIMPDGYGFLRRDNYLQGSKDIYVPPQYIRRFSLRQGDFVVGPVKLQRESDRYQALLYIKEVNGLPPEKMQRRPNFDKLTPIYPEERLILESTRNELSTRIIDLVAPIGKGQRGMIVSPPKAGKTILLQKIANAISLNNPEAKLIVLLIDERPEEVTDMQRTINGEVVFSTFDKTPENHTKVVELVLERAMRLVELEQDVIILLDSMTRLARAYNLTINPTGRTLSGGLDPGALYGPKRFFGAARNIENGGSLTIIATSLIETGSRMDEVIFEEFKGTGNMEVYLDRKLSEKRIFPAIDINKSGTRREELLLTERELDAVWKIRKALSQLDTAAVTEAIIALLLKTQNNEHFSASINVTFNDKNMYDSMRGGKSGQNGQQQGSSGQYNKTGYTSR